MVKILWKTINRAVREDRDVRVGIHGRGFVEKVIVHDSRQWVTNVMGAVKY